MNNTIVWFTKQQSSHRWRIISWLMVMVFLLAIVAASGVIQFVTSRSQQYWFGGVSWLGIQSLLAPTPQHMALTLIKYMRDHKPLPQNTLHQLYSDWYNEYCIEYASWSDLHSWLYLWCSLYQHREILSNYLWYKQPKTYLILLQNSAEVRPNGWFYGSFIRITLVSGMIQEMKVHDSYEVPFTNSWVSLDLPSWTSNYLWHNNATFIAGNKFGFTDRDGFIIRAIYNKTYKTNIDWVVFISTKTLTTLIPSLQDQLRRWQFMNASVDLIRWHTWSFKKNLYMSDMNQYLKENKVWLMVQGLSNYSALLQQGMVQLYLPDIDTQFRATLKQFGWITDLDSNHLYLRDINQSYSKIDTFVRKHIQIQDQEWVIVVDSFDNVLDLAWLKKWIYTISVNYSVSLSSRYRRLIDKLSDEYDISLGDREYHILWLNELFSYRSVIFAWSGVVINDINWGSEDALVFDAGWWSAAAYYVSSTWDNHTITVTFTKK